MLEKSTDEYNNEYMKKRLLIVLSVLFVCIEMALAKPVPIGRLYYELNASKKTACVTNIGEEDPSFVNGNYRRYLFSWPMIIEIPSTVTYKGVKYTVIEIEENAFQFSNTRSVTIPGSVKKIGAHAFVRSEYLEEVKLNQGLYSIETGAFTECKHLRQITFPYLNLY